MVRQKRITGWRQCLAVASVAAIISGCGGGEPATDAPAAQSTAAAASRPANASEGSQDWKPTIRTATAPNDPCGWIPAADVEAVLGKFAEPPRVQDGCRYTLPVPESVMAKRKQAEAAREKFRQAFGTPPAEPAGGRSIFEVQEDPRSFSVTVSVDLNAKRGTESASETTAAGDWDEVRRTRTGLNGRVGHVRIIVNRQSPEVPSEPMHTLGERVRERIPDLPFPVTNPYQVIQLAGGDPCSLLTRAEAEAVLGPLAIEPYRSSSEWPGLAHAKGHACAYYSAGHRVFVLSPTWSGGESAYKIDKGIGGLIGIVAPQETVVLKGPWDQGQVSGTSGALMFLKGDRLLEVHYGTSRATRGEAVKLAATAMRRLAP